MRRMPSAFAGALSGSALTARGAAFHPEHGPERGLAKAIDAEARNLRTLYETEIEEPERQAAGQMSDKVAAGD